MANRTWHMVFGFIVYLAFVILFVFGFAAGKNFTSYMPWILVGFGLSMFGAELPDYDQIADKIFNHRDALTHSILIPGIVFIVIRAFAPYINYVAIAPLLLLVFLGHASHLFLDLFPVWKGSTETVKPKKKGAKAGPPRARGLMTPVSWLIEGITGEEIVAKLEGTYLIHLPIKIPDVESGKKPRKGAQPKVRKTLTKPWTRLWLTLNAVIDLILCVLLYNAFMPVFEFPI